MNDLS